jgi:hypothetical protein
MLRTVRMVRRRFRQQFFRMSGRWRSTIYLSILATEGSAKKFNAGSGGSGWMHKESIK